MTHKIQLVNISYWKELGAERESNAARGVHGRDQKEEHFLCLSGAPVRQESLPPLCG